MNTRWLRTAALCIVALAGSLPAAAHAEPFTVKTLHFDTVVGPSDDHHCDVVADLYRPESATAAHPAPAILTTNGFGGSKDGEATTAKAFAARGYVVLAYSGLGFGGSGCKITLDDRDYDGKAGSQLVSFLGGGKAAKDGTRVDVVQLDATAHDGTHHAHDPRVGMIGGSYGGQIQFAVAGIDPRLDTIVPFVTWNDLSYSLAPNNTSFERGVSYATPGAEKVLWTTFFFAQGALISGVNPGLQNDPSRMVGCPNFDDRACAAKIQMDLTGAPNDATIAFARHASVASFIDRIRIPTMLLQGQRDTLFNLQESVATYQALKAQGTPVKLVWQQGGHSGAGAPGELDFKKAPGDTYQGRAIAAWMDHYLRDAPAAPSLDFTYFRNWVKYSGDATPAYGRAPAYPAAASTRDLYLSGSSALTDRADAVQPGAPTLLTTAAGLPTSYSELSVLDQSAPLFDAPGTFARFESAPLDADADVIGVPSVDVRVSAPVDQFTGQAGAPGELVLFFKLYDVGPDGAEVLPNRLISPVRIVSPDQPVHVELPGIVHRFAKGHRFALIVSGGDSAYRGGNVPGPVSIVTDPARPGVLHLPVVAPAGQGAVVEASAPAGSKACTGRRSLSLRLPRALRSRARSVLVYVAGRRVATLRGRRVYRTVSVPRLRSGRTTVRYVVRTKAGRKVVVTKRYRTCARG